MTSNSPKLYDTAATDVASVNGTKIKLESRAADLKKQLLRQRQLSADPDGRHSRSSSAAPMEENNNVVNARSGPPAFAPYAVPEGMPSTQHNLSETDIDELIAGLAPPEPINSPQIKGDGKPTDPPLRTETANTTNAAARVRPTPLPLADRATEREQPAPRIGQQPRTPSHATSAKAQQDGAAGKQPPRDAVKMTDGKVASSRKDSGTQPKQTNGTAKRQEPTRTTAAAAYRHTESEPAPVEAGRPSEDDVAMPFAPCDARTDEAASVNGRIVGGQDERDLQDWLLFTNYYDVAYRTQFLNRRRRLAALEAERQQLLEEEKECEATAAARRQFSPFGVHPMANISVPASVMSTPSSSISSLVPASASASASGFGLPSSSLTLSPLQTSTSAFAARVAAGDQDGTHGAADKNSTTTNTIIPTKRPYEPSSASWDSHTNERAPKQTRVENTTTKVPSAKKSDVKTANQSNPKQQEKYTEKTNGSVGRQQPDAAQKQGTGGPALEGASRPETSLPSGPPRDVQRPGWHSKSFDNDGEDDRSQKTIGYDSYKGSAFSGGYRPPDDGPRNRHTPLVLGRKGETRFFLVKSFNESNVECSMEDGLWTTQLKNGKILTEAFETCRNVILFFSVNKSRAFQGFARMASPPSVDIPLPSWMRNIHWETTPPFRLEWLNTATTAFRYVHHLINDYNEHRSVIIGKDGQEVEEECGRELLMEMECTRTQRPLRSPSPPMDRRPISRSPEPGRSLRRDRTW